LRLISATTALLQWDDITTASQTGRVCTLRNCKIKVRHVEQKDPEGQQLDCMI